MFGIGAQAVGPTVFCAEGWLLLADEVGLDGEPEAFVAPVRRFGIGLSWKSGLMDGGFSGVPTAS